MYLFKQRLIEMISNTIAVIIMGAIVLVPIYLLAKYLSAFLAVVMLLIIVGFIGVAIYVFINWLFIEPFKSRKKRRS